ncbi:3-hydroxyacyl-CoA dehydrogenase NAD-binding domain-containing protein [Blastomonas sp. UPD001]|uniref:3-hydroxyacyl-CoA dehydrogenase NAD-binding domain-containing protein n=1 Tax=Blastomonas sp. UPD001 TaxID=2217673 RepID=UPI0018E4F2E8|nr:3-hydroxyacyl-CoA dehydrogenase NAD-binding domain-containing protein [Blastomonas sp. UPD001]
MTTETIQPLARAEVINGIGLIVIDNPPVNAVGPRLRRDIRLALADHEGNPLVGAVVICCDGRTFMAGADMTAFGETIEGGSFQELLDDLDSFPKPVVAAIHGTALGGGLEIALACHYRVAVKGTKIGLPEVNIGLIPGAGGTQRLPRLIGVGHALEVITTGKHVPVENSFGVIDDMTESDLRDFACAFARNVVAKGGAQPRLRDRAIKVDVEVEQQFAQARASVAKSMRGQAAPLRAIAAVEAAVRLPFEEGEKEELRLIKECFADAQAKALQNLFFAERQASRLPQPVSAAPIDFKTVGVIGCGTMGLGIAITFLRAGYRVVMHDEQVDVAKRCQQSISEYFTDQVKKGRIAESAVAKLDGDLTVTNSLDDFADCDLVIEAIVEDLSIKQSLFKRLDALVSPDCVLASNTSYLPIDQIGENVRDKRRLLGIHFFSPAHIMKLCEVIRAEQTDPAILAATADLARKIGKTVVIAGNCYGFIANRMMEAYSREAALMVLEGAEPQQIDAALYDFGMPMGILQVHDLSGLDIGYRNRRNRPEHLRHPLAPMVPDALVEAGRLGLKSGGGYYDYSAGSRLPLPSAAARDIIEKCREEAGLAKQQFSAERIIQRCFLPVVNMGFAILREGNAYRESDLDVAIVNGFGFPRHKGGPMHWARHIIGLDGIVDGLQRYSVIYGERWWRPDELLVKQAAVNG